MAEKFFYFDLGGVMFNYKHSLAKVVASLGFSMEEFTPAWQGPDDLACRGDITTVEMWTRILKTLGYAGQPRDLTEQWVDGFTPIYQMHDMAYSVSKYCALGILSNLYPGLYPVLLERGLVPNLNWDEIVLSSDIHSRKPEVRMYIQAEQKAQRHPSKLVFLDDKRVNVDTAVERGWKGILYEDNINYSDTLKLILG